MMKAKIKPKVVFWPEDPNVEDIYSDRVRETLLEEDGLSNEEEGFMKGYSNSSGK